LSSSSSSSLLSRKKRECDKNERKRVI